jgi:propanol-preferring alcohol dehydrogenase
MSILKMKIIGCSGVGRVYAVGPGVKCFKEGDRVMCSCITDACLSCDHCLNGWETACDQCKIGSAHQDGTFAQFFLAKEAFVC